MKTHLILFSALLLICTGAGFAQGTPDNLPPALETVCDAETGAAYGLCNAYCEAMDCETDAPSASATACDKVRTKFENIAGHNVPCEAAACPCTSIPEYNAILAGANFCYDGGNVMYLWIGPENPGIAPYVANYSVVCGYVDHVGNNVIALPTTPEQAEACFQLGRDAAASRGVTCTGAAG